MGIARASLACRSSDSPTSGEISDKITALIAAKTAVPMLIATPKPTSMPSLLGRYESNSRTLNPSCRLRQTRRTLRIGYTARLPQNGAHAAATSQGWELPPIQATAAARKFPARASGAPMKDRATGHATDPVRPLLVPIVRAPSRAHDINDETAPVPQTPLGGSVLAVGSDVLRSHPTALAASHFFPISSG